MNQVCRDCEAYMWIEERRCTSAKRFPKFSVCCAQGKVLLPALQQPSPALYSLLTGDDTKSSNFRQKIRSYNSALAFTSMGAKIDESVTGARGMFILL